MADERDDRGGGQISAAVGVTVLLLTLLLTVHVLLGAWASSRLGALAHESARLVAESPDPGTGEGRARAMLASIEPDARLEIRVVAGSPATVEATVTMPGPTLAGTVAPFATIERSARLPIEAVG
ncbi:MAG: hypothetical protein AAGA99_01820 [Actinomycetota bacterium]